MTTKIDMIRNLFKNGFVGTYHQAAAELGIDSDRGISTLIGLMKRQKLVEIVDYEWVGDRYKRSVYQATPLIFDDSIPTQPPRLGQRKKEVQLKGYKGLICAVIAAAVKDATTGTGKRKREALEWFESEPYQFYMEGLGLPPELKPEFMREAGR
jgi:hypothetical protein